MTSMNFRNLENQNYILESNDNFVDLSDYEGDISCNILRGQSGYFSGFFSVDSVANMNEININANLLFQKNQKTTKICIDDLNNINFNDSIKFKTDSNTTIYLDDRCILSSQIDNFSIRHDQQLNINVNTQDIINVNTNGIRLIKGNFVIQNQSSSLKFGNNGDHIFLDDNDLNIMNSNNAVKLSTQELTILNNDTEIANFTPQKITLKAPLHQLHPNISNYVNISIDADTNILYISNSNHIINIDSIDSNLQIKKILPLANTVLENGFNLELHITSLDNNKNLTLLNYLDSNSDYNIRCNADITLQHHSYISLVYLDAFWHVKFWRNN
ncbi:hypothetical protein CPAV1605_829 [seawater metagenome]|uniref:Uncharacterized protein n=1 Tax=seawater metagenome TaxID=1561972 RepID=A0A5E8CKA3_9ZZZZ